MDSLLQIEKVLSLLKEVKACQLKVDRLSAKTFHMNTTTHSLNSIKKEHTNLNWACMNLDKAKTDFIRGISGSSLDVSGEEKEYNPSGFHCYKH